MWPYIKRRTPFHGDIRERSPSQLVGERFDINDAAIKLWMPDRLLAAVDVLTFEQMMSRADVLRWILFEHVFGRAELAHLRERQRLRDLNRLIDDRPMFSRKTAGASARALRVRFMGKSTEEMKVEVPSLLRESLLALASESGEALSEYVRRILARDLLPEREYQQWQAAIPK